MEKVFCLNCEEEKEFYIKEVTKNFMVKSVVLKAKVKECFCKDCNKHIFVYEIEKENQRIIFDTYKRKVGLLTSTELIELRKKYNLSQRGLAKIICCGEKNIARYENGAIQDQSINLLFVMLKKHPEYFGLGKKSTNLKEATV